MSNRIFRRSTNLEDHIEVSYGPTFSDPAGNVNREVVVLRRESGYGHWLASAIIDTDSPRAIESIERAIAWAHATAHPEIVGMPIECSLPIISGKTLDSWVSRDWIAADAEFFRRDAASCAASSYNTADSNQP